jgi:L-lysine exporter family protein LysE/ArgO
MHVFNCLWQGFLTGTVLSLMLGTVFFSLIRNSLRHGYRTGIYIALGVIVCDIIFITLGLLSHGFAVFLKTYETAISVVGGGVLAVMGLLMIINSKPKVQEGKEINPEKNSPFYFFANGFLLNVLNPVNFFSWLAISSMLTIKYNYDIPDKVIFFTASLASIFIVEVLIAHFASKLKKLVTPMVLKRINQVSGLIFLILGLRLAIGVLF